MEGSTGDRRERTSWGGKRPAQQKRRLQGIESLLLPVGGRALLVHGFENIRKSLLASIAGGQRDLDHGQLGKDQQPCRFRQLSAPDIVVKGHARRGGEHAVQMVSGIMNRIGHPLQIQVLV